MTTLTDFNVTDNVTDNLATYNNRFLGSMFSADNTNTISITALKELADSDCIYQVVTTDGSAIELPPEATTNHPHLIYNASAANTLPVKDDSGVTTFITLAADEWALFMPVSGEAWEKVATNQPTTSTYVVLSSASPRVYTSGDTWSKPAGIHHVVVEVVGGGGGGGGAAGGGSGVAVGGAGGGGEYRKIKVLAASLGATETVTIGAGGTAGTAGANNGGNGGNTSFGAHVTANGGSLGSGNTSTTSVPAGGGLPGAGGTGGSGGSVVIPGSPGQIGTRPSVTVTTPSVGGASHLSGTSASLTSGGTDEDGAAGQAYGGGGSGGRSSSDATDRAGGAGAAGVCIVWEYVEA